MKSIGLLGDSIRLHYQPKTIAALQGIADVWGPADNCRSSADLLANLDRFALARRPDIVHFNCGAHDIRHDGGATQPLVPLSDYAANLEVIFGLLSNTGATLIWASTTPIIEARHQAVRDSRRFEADVEIYNSAAAGIALRHGAQINDLHKSVTLTGSEHLLGPDGLHFTDVGYTFLAEQVTRALLAKI